MYVFAEDGDLLFLITRSGPSPADPCGQIGTVVTKYRVIVEDGTLKYGHLIPLKSNPDLLPGTARSETDLTNLYKR